MNFYIHCSRETIPIYIQYRLQYNSWRWFIVNDPESEKDICHNLQKFCILKQKHVCTVLKRNQNNKNEISIMTLSKEKRDGDLDDLYRWLKSCRLLSGVSQSQRSVRIVTSALAAGLTWSVLQTVQVMICWTFWYSLCSMNFTARKKYILKKQHTSRLI